MLHGEPGYAIADFVATNNIDLVIMGTVGRAGIKGFLIGNTAETIVNLVDCSVMAIKPDNFISTL
jgi:universal stress protein E